MYQISWPFPRSYATFYKWSNLNSSRSNSVKQIYNLAQVRFFSIYLLKIILSPRAFLVLYCSVACNILIANKYPTLRISNVNIYIVE